MTFLTEKFSKTLIGGAFLVGLSVPSIAEAATIQTTVWDPSGVSSGGTGTLGSITVTYSTSNPPEGNAGATIPDNSWDTSLASASAGPFSSQSAGILGVTSYTVPTTTPQSVTFSAAVNNPILLFNYTDANTTLDFGSASVTLLSANNAQLSGSTVNFIGSSNGFHDGIAIRINQSFGPGSPLNFSFTANTPSVSNFDSIGFTVGVSTPEPSSMAALGAIAVLGGSVALRRQRSSSKNQ